MRWFGWFRPPAVARQDDARAPGEVSMDMVAQPLVVGEGQDPVAYAHFRLDQLAKHIADNPGTLTERFMDEARTETYTLLHTLRVHGQISEHEELSHLWRVIASMKPEK